MEYLDVQYGQYNEDTNSNRSVLLHPRLPRKFLRPPLEILTLVPELLTHVTHVIELFTSIQDLINVLAHDRVNLGQVFRQLRVVRILAVTVVTLFFLNDGIVMNKLEGTGGLIDRGPPLVSIGP